MIYFLDTADLDAIKKAVDLYPLSGVTTNPTIVARENKPLTDIILGIRELIGTERLLHVQVIGKPPRLWLRRPRRCVLSIPIFISRYL